LYSVPGELIGQHVSARADSKPVKVSSRGEMVKVHPRVGPGKRQTDATDLAVGEDRVRDARHRPPAPRGRRRKRRRRHLRRQAARRPAAVDQDAPGLQAPRLVKQWGAERVNTACAKASIPRR